MTTGYPLGIAPAAVAARVDLPSKPKPSPDALGSWRYDCNPRSRVLLVLAMVISASIHAAVFFGFSRAQKKTAPPKAEHLIALTLAMPDLKDLEEPEPASNDDAGQTTDVSIPVPMQADLPQLARPNDFVQQIDFSSLMERPDFGQVNLLSVPENIRRGGERIAEHIGAIFNLSDLDRVPEPILQPPPAYPAAMKREGIVATVVVEFIVDTHGRVINAIATESTHRAFDEAAVSGVQKWRFRPGVRTGQKVNTRMRVPISFKILDEFS